MGCPIRKSPDHCVVSAPRCLSQLPTSFIGTRRQGIHRMPLLPSSPRPPSPGHHQRCVRRPRSPRRLLRRVPHRHTSSAGVLVSGVPHRARTTCRRLPPSPPRGRGCRHTTPGASTNPVTRFVAAAPPTDIRFPPIVLLPLRLLRCTTQLRSPPPTVASTRLSPKPSTLASARSELRTAAGPFTTSGEITYGT